MLYPVYVIANGDLFREDFNAIVTLLGTQTFTTAIAISMVFSTLGAVAKYIQSKDLMVLPKWFGLYFFITVILIGPKMDIQIIDVTQPGRSDLTVDHVPYGVAMPATIITSVSHALTQTVDDVFHMPDDLSYTKTGMLFGSNLFRLSTDFTITDATLRQNMNNYIKSCVIGDILINHKYTAADVLNSNNIWATVTQNPSPLRGLYLYPTRQFYTCREATPLLSQALNKEAGQTAMTYYANRIIGDDNPTMKAQFSQYLSGSYQYFANMSQTATQILQQNLMTNAMRSGVANYLSSTGNTAEMENWSTTTSMGKLRMAWATSRHIATETLPLLQTVLLALIFCVFPIIVLIAFQPGIGPLVLKNYLYTLIWLESWPILFAMLNFSATFYLQSHTSSLAANGVTLSNANPLALEHSDIAGVAGYLALAIPFLSYGLVKGMAATFNQAAQYFGGMTHSIAQGGATESVLGNFNLGNTSVGNTSAMNLNANKHDTNYTDFHGHQTEQLASGATQTFTPSGQTIYNATGAMSHLPMSVNAGQAYSESWQQAHDKFIGASHTHREAFDQAASSALSTMAAYDHSSSHNDALSHGHHESKAAHFIEAFGRHQSMAEALIKKENINQADAYTKFSQASLNESAGIDSRQSLAGKLASAAVGLSGKINVSADQTAQSRTAHDYNHGVDHNISADDARQWRQDEQTIQDYRESEDTTHSSNQTEAVANKLNADYREMQNAATSYSADLQQAEHAKQMATYAETHSQSIQENLSQPVAARVTETYGGEAANILTNTTSQKASAIRDQVAQGIIQEDVANQTQAMNQHLGAFNPQKFYQENSSAVHQEQQSVMQHDQTNQATVYQAAGHKADFDSHHAAQIKQEVGQQVNATQQKVATQTQAFSNNVHRVQTVDGQAIDGGKQMAQQGLTRHALNGVWHLPRTLSNRYDQTLTSIHHMEYSYHHPDVAFAQAATRAVQAESAEFGKSHEKI